VLFTFHGQKKKEKNARREVPYEWGPGQLDFPCLTRWQWQKYYVKFTVEQVEYREINACYLDRSGLQRCWRVLRGHIA
jgi:hypothetical protein